jgi:D-alanyl-D-alanine-carboxypeptidase/D-alanyl-D-alanine-endopeptidase
MRRTFSVLLLLVATTLRADVREILASRVAKRPGIAVVAGTIDANGRKVVAEGAADGDTLFEIGSATKVFTALLLAEAVQRGEVKLDDPVAKFLPASVKVPERNGRRITLQDLATHTSGLPRLPSNLLPKDESNPYADYTVAQMYEFLSSYELPRDAGAQYEYSNLAVGLLGHALALRAKTDYATLVRTRILEPLGMKDTFITIPAAAKARLAQGHDGEGKPAANWDLPTLAGAGALRSTVNDMLIFLSAFLGHTKTPLAPAMASMLASRRPTTMTAQEIALGWHVEKRGERELVWHDGGTGGYRSYLGLDPKARTGVVVLTNISMPAGVDDIGHHLLDATSPLLAEQKPATVDPKIYDRFVGRYALAPEFLITITREGNQLFAQATGQPRFEIFPKSEREYFFKVVDARITFADDALTLHQGGRDMRAPRVTGELPSRKEIAVDAALLEKYVGRYQLAPAFIIAITKEGNALFAQATGQPKFPLFAESERKFFLKVVDAQLTFEVDGTGRATGIVLHQGGMDQKAKRIE